MNRSWFSVFIALVVLIVDAGAQDTLRIATYNVLNYPGNDATIRNPHFRAVTKTMNPDVLVVQEMQSASGVTQFRDNVLNAGQPGAYTSVTFDDGPDTDNAMFYKSSEVSYIGATYISNSPRRIAEYRFKPVGGTDTVRLYSLHLKANLEDSLARLTEATTLRNYLNALPSGAKFIIAGDYNIYRSTEAAFQKLIGSEADNDGRCKDPLNAIGTWNNNIFSEIHTQSTRTRSFGDPSAGSTGGLDDRFDMLLISYPMEPHLLLSTYTAYGNDGNHFNDSINQSPNTAVPDSVADGLHYGSDHLPVFADFVFGTSGPDTGFTSIASGNWNTPGTWSGGAIPTLSSNVTIGAGTTVTIDGNVSGNTITVAGTLLFDGTDGRSLTLQSDCTIESGGEMRSSATFASGSTTQSVTTGGDFTNNGTFTPRVTGSSSGTRVIHVTFDGSVPVVISGTTNPTSFSLLRMNLSTTTKTLTPLINILFVGNTASALTLTRGTWLQSTGQTTTPGVNITIDSNAVLAVSDAGALATGSASLLVRGVLNVAGGALNVGGGNNRLEVLGGGTAEFAGGTTTIGGRLTLTAGATSVSGGAITINPRGGTNLGASSNVFEVAASAAMEMTGGEITIVNPKTATTSGRELKIVSGSGIKTFTSGVIALGDGISTLAGSDTGFVIESGVPLPDLLLRTGGVTGRDVALASNLTVTGLELQSGTLKLADPYMPGFDLTITGDLLRTAGGLATGTRTITMSAPIPADTTSIAGDFIGSNGLHHLVIANPSGVNLDGDMEIEGTLSLNSGLLRTNAATVLLGPAAVLNETPGNTIVGRVAATRNVLQSIDNPFGGIGLEIKADGAAAGSTTVVRTTGTAFTSGFASSITRSFEITPAANGGLDARLRYYYDLNELNGQQASTLQLWRSEDDGATWALAGGTVDTTLRRIEVTGLDSLSTWTASDADNPLSQFSVPVALVNGWNLVSVPVVTPADSVQQLFSLCPPFVAYSFGGSSGYQQNLTMDNGIGYWLKCSGGNVQLAGVELLEDTIAVGVGWNLIGSISVAVDTESVIQLPAGILASQFFEYSGTYSAVATIQPGKAYWVKANAAGGLVLQAPPARKSRAKTTGK